MNTEPTLAERTPHIPLAVLRELWRDARFRYRNYPVDQSDLFREYVHDELQQMRIVELEAALAAAHEQLANSAEMLPPQIRPTLSIDYKEATNDTD